MTAKSCDLCGESLRDYAAIFSLTELVVATSEVRAKELWLCNDCAVCLVAWLNANRVVRPDSQQDKVPF